MISFHSDDIRHRCQSQIAAHKNREEEERKKEREEKRSRSRILNANFRVRRQNTPSKQRRISIPFRAALLLLRHKVESLLK